MKKRNGFTLVELLAVIVILAIILVIAVPQIMGTIESATQASMESSAKMIASQAENQYAVAQTLGKIGDEEGQFKVGTAESMATCGEWAGINDVDYDSCSYYISDGNAYVTLVGKGKFAGYTCTSATRSSATCTKATNNGE